MKIEKRPKLGQIDVEIERLKKLKGIDGIP